jgi:plasmid maintenance system antidote protein VapI
MTQQELADLCDTNRSHISKLVNNKTNCVTLAIALKISRALKQPIENLFTLAKID